MDRPSRREPLSPRAEETRLVFARLTYDTPATRSAPRIHAPSFSSSSPPPRKSMVFAFTNDASVSGLRALYPSWYPSRCLLDGARASTPPAYRHPPRQRHRVLANGEQGRPLVRVSNEDSSRFCRAARRRRCLHPRIDLVVLVALVALVFAR